MSVAAAIADIAIIDVDAHISEPHDLWTSRAPAAYKDRMSYDSSEKKETPAAEPAKTETPKP